MSTAQKILVATFARPNFLLVERATRNQGIAVAQVDPTLDAVSACVPSDTPTVVVVDALQYEEKALQFCKGVKSKYQHSRILFLGTRADISSVAKAISAGARDYFLPHTPIDELVALIAGAVANKSPPDDSLCGRVRSTLPAGRTPDGRYQMHDGSLVTPTEALLHCESLGLSGEDIVTVLGLSEEQIASLNESLRKSVHGNVMGWLWSLLGGSPHTSATTDSPQNAGADAPLITLLSVLGVLIAAVIGWRLLFMGNKQLPADHFVTLKGAVRYEDGSALETPVSLIFGLSVDDAATPLYAGVATVDASAGAFSTLVRVPSQYAPPYIFRVAILGRSLLPLGPAAVPSACSDLLTTPLVADASRAQITIRCPKPDSKVKDQVTGDAVK
jgi:DNA-binding NarL/FixJ family response regulator